MMGVGELATIAGIYLTAKASGKLAENVGGEIGDRIVKLWDAVAAKLTRGDEPGALARLEAKPEDERRCAALELELEEALEADLAFRDEIETLVRELEQKGGRDAINQIANVTGDQNKVAQVAGGKNSVTF